MYLSYLLGKDKRSPSIRYLVGESQDLVGPASGRVKVTSKQKMHSYLQVTTGVKNIEQKTQAKST
jgi:hypothetical protein